ncbi:hypothetical protein HMPREF0973_01566 [Prevotella veroralis F0319]|uniref:Uncharacterized protein n=1 Tax=Prevotella veroralis F0319 TaxID=649761 RepID=C9MPM5_9BACT|nr:hypothetical protein HMPREF0973_01566 [Prevotella veroralis F0319]
MVFSYLIPIFALRYFQASHNKDYSVVKTNKVGQLTFFRFIETKVIFVS